MIRNRRKFMGTIFLILFVLQIINLIFFRNKLFTFTYSFILILYCIFMKKVSEWIFNEPDINVHNIGKTALKIGEFARNKLNFNEDEELILIGFICSQYNDVILFDSKCIINDYTVKVDFNLHNEEYNVIIEKSNNELLNKIVKLNDIHLFNHIQKLFI